MNQKIIVCSTKHKKVLDKENVYAGERFKRYDTRRNCGRVKDRGKD